MARRKNTLVPDDILKPWLRKLYRLLQNWDHTTRSQYPKLDKALRNVKKQIEDIYDDIENEPEIREQIYEMLLQSGNSDVEQILTSQTAEGTGSLPNDLTEIQKHLAKR